MTFLGPFQAPISGYLVHSAMLLMILLWDFNLFDFWGRTLNVTFQILKKNKGGIWHQNCGAGDSILKKIFRESWWRNKRCRLRQVHHHFPTIPFHMQIPFLGSDNVSIRVESRAVQITVSVLCVQARCFQIKVPQKWLFS